MFFEMGDDCWGLFVVVVVHSDEWFQKRQYGMGRRKESARRMSGVIQGKNDDVGRVHGGAGGREGRSGDEYVETYLDVVSTGLAW